MSVIRIPSDTATIVKVVTTGPQGPQGERGPVGATAKPFKVPAGDYTLTDGDRIVADGPAEIFFPAALPAETGVSVSCGTGTLTLTALEPGDSVSIATLTDGQSADFWPLINEWLKA